MEEVDRVRFPYVGVTENVLQGPRQFRESIKSKRAKFIGAENQWHYRRYVGAN